MLDLKKDKLLNQKMLYIFLIIIILLGLGTGIFYHFFLEKELKLEIISQMDNFFTIIKEGNLDYSLSLGNSLCSSGLSLFLIWILGISIIGIPFIIIHLFYKSFIIGFSFIAIIANYHFKGLFLALTYIFPHHILNLVIWLLLSFYAIYFSIRLIKVLFFKKNIALRDAFKKYTKILILSIIVFTISSFLETYLAPYLMNFFLK